MGDARLRFNDGLHLPCRWCLGRGPFIVIHRPIEALPVKFHVTSGLLGRYYPAAHPYWWPPFWCPYCCSLAAPELLLLFLQPPSLSILRSLLSCWLLLVLRPTPQPLPQRWASQELLAPQVSHTAQWCACASTAARQQRRPSCCQQSSCDCSGVIWTVQHCPSYEVRAAHVQRKAE